MLIGVFRVTFQSSLATVGEAVAVFDACGGVHGASEHHAFRGRQPDGGGGFEVEVLHLCGAPSPLLGCLPSVRLDMTVTREEPDGFHAAGAVRGAAEVRLNVVARRLCALAD